MNKKIEETLFTKIEPVLRDKLEVLLKENLGNRSISSDDFNLLRDYWIASLVSEIPEENVQKCLDENLDANGIENLYLNTPVNGWDRGVEDYNSFSGTNLLELLSKKIINNRDRKINVLDIGYGGGFFLNEIKNLFRDNIETYGISYRKEKLKDESLVPDNFKLSLAEVLPYEFEDKFDLVTCFEASMYFFDEFKALNEALNTLRVGGNFYYGSGISRGNYCEKIIDKNPVIKDFGYVANDPNLINYGSRFRGSLAYNFKNNSDFRDYIDKLKEMENIELDGKVFDLSYHRASAFCPNVLQVIRKE